MNIDYGTGSGNVFEIFQYIIITIFVITIMIILRTLFLRLSHTETGIFKKNKEYRKKIKNGICPNCGSELITKYKSDGEYYSCTNSKNCYFIVKKEQQK